MPSSTSYPFYTPTGITHFKKVSGKEGVFIGTKGNEVRIDTGNQTYVVTLNASAGSTALHGAYIVVPYDVTLVAAYAQIASGTVGTGASVTINLTDTAGASLFGTASFTSAGTAGAQLLTFGTMSTATISATGVIAITQASCATAYGASYTIVATRASGTA